MNKGDAEKNEPEKNTIKNRLIGGLPERQIPIPALNEYPLKDVKHWAKSAYSKARRQLHWRRAKKKKVIMPIETAAYAEDKVFGNWRLVAPSADGEKSPLQQAIEWLRPFIEIASLPLVARNDVIARSGATKQSQVPTRWGEFRRKFVCEIKIDFNAICDSDYDPAMVDEVNQRLNQLIGTYLHRRQESCHAELVSASIETPKQVRGDISCHFVLRPETAEDYSSLRFLTIRSGIWMRWTGVPLDFSQFIKPPGAKPICRQMEMYLDMQVSSS